MRMGRILPQKAEKNTDSAYIFRLQRALFGFRLQKIRLAFGFQLASQPCSRDKILTNVFILQYTANIDKTFLFGTIKDAPMNKVVTIDIGCPDPVKSMKDLIPTDEKATLDTSNPVYGKYLILGYTRDVKVPH